MTLCIVSRGGLRVACEATGSKWWPRASPGKTHKESEGDCVTVIVTDSLHGKIFSRIMN